MLDQGVEGLLDEEGGVEDDEAVGEGEDVVGGADFEEGADGALLYQHMRSQSHCSRCNQATLIGMKSVVVLLTSPSI